MTTVRRGRPAGALYRRLSSIAWPTAASPSPTRPADPALGPRPRLRRGRPRATRSPGRWSADLLTYLPGDLLVKVDLASMAHSLECRGPFLDHRVVELAAGDAAATASSGSAAGRSKVVLKQAFADLLPPPIRTRPKMGFGVPIDRWFRGELKDELRAVLLDPIVASTAACSAPRPSAP